MNSPRKSWRRPLDFSRYTEAPAGRYGSIIARPDGTLGFEKAPGKRIRLYGANICFSACYLEKAEADKLAADFRKLGYNSLRIHHYDDLLVDPEAPDSVTFDAARARQARLSHFRDGETGNLYYH